MPSWKKVLISGSDASLNTLIVTNGITGSLYGTASWAISSSYARTASYSQNLQISGSINNVDYIDFNTGSATPAYKSGRVFFDNVDGALTVYNAEADIALQVGQENWVRVFNEGGLITNGTAVRLVGSHGDVPLITKAQSIQVSGSALGDNQIIGIATHDIETNSIGYATTQGLARGFDTSTFTDGDLLFVSSSAGILTNVMPIAPYEVIQVGVCVKAGPGGSGIVFVFPTQPIDFGDLSSAERGTYQYGDIWSYVPSGSVGVWRHGRQLSGSYAITGSLAQGAEGNTASGENSHAEGGYTLASVVGAHSEGFYTTSSGTYSHAEGYFTLASGQYSHAEGSTTMATGYASHAEGWLGISQGDYSHTEGQQTIALGSYSHTEGYLTTGSGAYSHAEGWLSTSQGDYSHAEGRLVKAFGQSSHAEGSGSLASGSASHAEGFFTISSGSYSHAEGRSTVSIGFASHAEGSSSLSSGISSHAEGLATTSSGTYSHAEGQITVASGQGSHAEGLGTLSSGVFSHAEGRYNTSSGNYSHAEGSGSVALGGFSHAEGWGTVASGSYQHVQGQYNISSSAQAAFIVGNGTSPSTRSNLIFASGSSVQITGSLQISASIFQYSNNAAIVSGSTANIASFPTSSYMAGFFDYVISSDTNARAGTVFTVWNGANIEYTETSTNDIGNTSDLILSASISGGDVLLQGTSLLGTWNVKTLARMI